MENENLKETQRALKESLQREKQEKEVISQKYENSLNIFPLLKQGLDKSQGSQFGS